MPDFQTILDTAILVLAIPTAIALLVTVIGAVICLARAAQASPRAGAGYGVWSYLRNQLIAIDQAVNTLCGGSPDETISAVAYRKGGSRFDPIRWRLAYRIINLLFFWQTDHCRRAYETERKGGHLHPSYQE